MTRKIKGVDFEAVQCLDMAHQWRFVEEKIGENGPLKGCPRRVKLCMVCGSLKTETLSWRGNILSRQYFTDPVYIKNARLLSDEVNERRRVYREQMLLGHKPKNICVWCGLPKSTDDHDECNATSAAIRRAKK